MQVFSEDGLPLLSGLVEPGKVVEVAGLHLQMEAGQYLVLEAVHDPGFWPVVAGGLAMMGGVMVAFLVHRRRVWARIAADEVLLAGRAEREATGFEGEFAALVAAVGRAVGG